MTALYAATDGNERGAAPTALRLGKDLGRLVAAGLDEANPAEVRAIVARMMSTEGHSPADALPLMHLAASLLGLIAQRMPQPLSGEEDGQRQLVIICAALTERATRTLETVTGIPAASFTGQVRIDN